MSEMKKALFPLCNYEVWRVIVWENLSRLFCRAAAEKSWNRSAYPD